MVDYIITGFGQFHNVEINPSEVLVKRLPSYLSSPSCPSPLNCNIIATHVVEVSIGGSLDAMAMLKSRCTHPPCANKKTLWVHFGVNAEQTNFRLEKVAWNEAKFRCPDQRGYQPVSEAIIPENTEPCIKSNVNVDLLANELSKKGFSVQTSEDPGRFLCNYIYYQSLHHSTQSGAYSIFVHVPPFSAVPIDAQLSFAHALLSTLPSYCSI